MGERRTRRRAAAAAGLPAGLLLAFGQPLSAAALQQPDYPTWDEVEQARANEAAAAAKVSELEGLLIKLEADAAEFNRAALIAAEDYHLATSALDEAVARLDRLRRQVDAAQARAEESERRVAIIVAQLARSGGADVTIGLLLTASADAESLLAQLGTAERLSESSRALLDRAIYDKKTADALAADARAAETERRRLAEEAESAYKKAERAAEAARAKADAQNADLDRMYAQLAALKGTTAQTEREYLEGRNTAPPPGPSPSDPPTSTPTPKPTSSPTPKPTSSPAPTPTPTSTPKPPAPKPEYPTPNASKVETAIAFATDQVGEKYQLGGMGPDVWDCSGLAKASYAAAGVYIGIHSSTDQYNYMKQQNRLVPRAQWQRGDLLFYSDGGSASNPRKYHVAIYLGDGKMIEAPNPTARVRIVNVRTGDLVPYVGRPTG